MSSSSKSRKLSVFDRLGPEEDLSHGSSSTTSRHAGYAGHKRSKAKHHRQSYEEDETTEKFSQQQSSYAHQSTKDRRGSSYSGSHHYHKPPVEEGVPSDGSDGEEAMKKDKYKRQYVEKELKEEYSKEKGKYKSIKSEKQLNVNEAMEGFTDSDDRSIPNSMDELTAKEKDTAKYNKVEVRQKDVPELVDTEAKESRPSKLDETRSNDEVVDGGGEKAKRFKSGKDKKRKHKVEKMKDEDFESAEDYDRQIPVAELDSQEFSLRGNSKRKVVDNKSLMEAFKKKRPLEEPPSYRERTSRSSKNSAGISEGDRSREGSWKPSATSESHKQTEAASSTDRYRDDRHSMRKIKSHSLEDDYNRRGRDRERERPTDGVADHSSRKRKRSFSPDTNYSTSKRPKRGKRDTDLYDSFSEEDMGGETNSDRKEKETLTTKNEVDLDLLFLEEDDECLKDTTNSAIDRYKPACVFLRTGISSALCGTQLYNSVSDIVLAHLQSQEDTPDEQVKMVSGVLQKNLTGLQVASQLGQYKTRNKLIKDVTSHSRAVTAQGDLSIRNKLKKTASSQRCYSVPNTELPPNWDSELYATGIELYKLNNNNKKSKLISSHCGTVVYM